MLKRITDPVVAPFQSLGSGGRVKPEIAPRPEFAPTFEPDLQQIAVDCLGALEPHYPIDKPAALQILARLIKITGRVAGGPAALGAVLSPCDQGARDQLALQLSKRTHHFWG